MGAYRGCQVVSVELEPKFVDMAKQNYALHAKKWERLGCPQPVMIQGDSRRLSEVIAGADCVVGSPPFQGAHGGAIDEHSMRGGSTWVNKVIDAGGYGDSPGQLGSMKPGSVDAVVSSPPYAEAISGSGKHGIKCDHRDHRKEHSNAGAHIYGQTPGNLGNLKPGDVSAIISSPPYEGQELDYGDRPNRASKIKDNPNFKGRKHWANNDRKCTHYGDMGQGDTFWQAAKEILQECHKILRPGGKAIWVVKAFVRKGEIVDFPGQWRRLCESVGFKTVCEHHAMLVKKECYAGLFGNIIEIIKEHKSFFKRLAESKGSPKIDYEVVLCTEKQQ
jgi:hypothetical protein